MSVSLVVGGVSYNYPQTGDQSWGDAASLWAQAITGATLQKSGGAFTLTADANFGATFGLISAYFTSRTANASHTGSIRLANADGIGFRNSGNSADILLKPDADGFLQYNSIDLVNISGTQTLTNKTMAAGSNTITGITNANLSGAAAIVNANLASMATLTLKGNNAGGGSTPLDLTVAQVNTMLGSLSNPMTTSGDTIYGGASGVATRLAGDTSNTRKFLRTLSIAGTAQPPAWDTLVAADVPPVTNLAGGLGGSIPYQSAVNTTVQLANGTSGQVLQSAGGTSAPAWQTLSGNATALKASTVQTLIATGSQTGWLFTISTSSTLAVGDTYTNNANTFTVQIALSGQNGQVLFMSGTGATSGATLTRATGAGTASITFSAKIATATYTRPSGPAPLYLRVQMVGGGGGGNGSGTTPGTAGVGGDTVFGIITAGGGPAAPSAAAATGGDVNIAGAPAPIVTSAATNVQGSGGANSYFGGGGRGGNNGPGAGGNAGTNSGSGGGGAGCAATIQAGGGGSSGAFAQKTIASPSATYPYAIGTAGAGGTLGTSGAAGGNGAAGIIIVEEFYQ